MHITWVRHGESISQMIEGANDDFPFNIFKQKFTEKEEDFTLSDLDIDDETFQNLLKKDMNKDESYKMKK